MALTRLQQLCIAQETIEGTVPAAGLFLAANGKYLAIDPSMTFEVETYTRDVARESFTPLSPLAGAQLGSCSFSLEAAGKTGTPATGTRPAFDLPLIACGFQRQLLYRIEVSGSAFTTGTKLAHGTTLTQGTSNATLFVVGDYYNGTQYVWATKGEIGLVNYLGNATAVTSSTNWSWTGGTFTATAGTPTITAVGWYPTSVPLYAMTFTSAQAFNAGVIIVGASGGIAIAYYAPSSATQVIVRRISGTFGTSESVTFYENGSSIGSGTTSASSSTAFVQVPGIAASISIGLSKDGVRESLKGARGSVSVSGNIGEPLLLNFNFQGIKDAVVDSGSVSGITYNDLTPPVLLGATMSIGDDGITSSTGQKTVCATALNIDFANDLQYRRCMSAATGIEGIYQNGRTPTMTLDPEQSPELDFDFMANYFAANNVRMDIVAGSATANKFRLKMNNMALQSIGQGDRNGLIVRDVSFALHSGTSSSVAGDNEFALIWDISV
jgi:hypothetical protein